MDLRKLVLLAMIIAAIRAHYFRQKMDNLAITRQKLRSLDITREKLCSLDGRIEMLENIQQEIYVNLVADMEEMEYEHRQAAAVLSSTTTDYPVTTTTTVPMTTPTEHTTTPLEVTTTTEYRAPHRALDCVDLFTMVQRDSKLTRLDGIYLLRIGDHLSPVRCEGEGWLIIQKRSDGSIDYNRTLEEYSQGFGEVIGEHWLGLHKVHQLTASGDWTLRVELESFHNETAWAEYTGFSVGAGPGFILNIDRGSYSGTAGNSLDYDDNYTLHRGMKFTTYDHDQDKATRANCAVVFGGGWWYNECMDATTTGNGLNNIGEMDVKTIFWNKWKGHDRLKAVTLKIRRN